VELGGVSRISGRPGRENGLAGVAVYDIRLRRSLRLLDHSAEAVGGAFIDSQSLSEWPSPARLRSAVIVRLKTRLRSLRAAQLSNGGKCAKLTVSRLHSWISAKGHVSSLSARVSCADGYVRSITQDLLILLWIWVSLNFLFVQKCLVTRLKLLVLQLLEVFMYYRFPASLNWFLWTDKLWLTCKFCLLS
jgi:hypothetical protein